jgi:hAT family C-terminal dimerisation region
MDASEQVPDGWSVIKWWWVSGCTRKLKVQMTYCEKFQVNSSRYHPAWSSLARDYLSIMSSSVSSERAFSQLEGGITITKQRNRFKGDIVEVLQGVKCAIRQDLLFREPDPSSILEAKLHRDTDGEVEDSEDSGEESEVDKGWNDVMVEDKDEGSEMDIESD